MKTGKHFNLILDGKIITGHFANNFSQAIIAFTRFLVSRKEPLAIAEDRKSFTVRYRGAITTFFVELA